MRLVLFVSFLAVCNFAAAAKESDVVIWNCDDAKGMTGIELEQNLRKEGKAAIRWRKHPEKTGIYLSDIPKDWSKHHELTFWVYNEKVVDTKIIVVISSENEKTEGSDYWHFELPLNFTGWKHCVYPIGINAPSPARKPLGWDQIGRLSFNASGWDQTANPEADIVIDDIRLKYNPPRPGPLLSDEEFFATLNLGYLGLEAVQAAVSRKQFTAAKVALLKYYQNRAEPRWGVDSRQRQSSKGKLNLGTSEWDYYSTSFKINWAGWKELRFPLSKWKASRKPQGWHSINFLQLNATFGSQVPCKESDLLFAKIELVSPKGKCYDLTDAKKWTGVSEVLGRTGKRAVRWQVGNGESMNARSIQRDLREYDELVVLVRSSVETADTITLVADSERTDMKKAEDFVRHEYDGFNLGRDIDWKSNKLPSTDPKFTREWTYSLNRFYHWKNMGILYWNSGDEKYAKEWIDQMRDWIEDNPYPLYGNGNKTLTWRTIEAGGRAYGSWKDAFPYFLSSPSLSADDFCMFMKSWYDHARHLKRVCLERNSSSYFWKMIESNGLGCIAIMLPEFKESSEWLRLAITQLHREAQKQFYPDGSHKALSPSYQQSLIRNLALLHVLGAKNGLDLTGDFAQTFRSIYEYSLGTMTPRRQLPPLNGSPLTSVTESMKQGNEIFGREDLLWAASWSKEGEKPQFTSKAFKWSGHYVMRDDWWTSKSYLLFEAGPYGVLGEYKVDFQHEDKLSMCLYSKGRLLLTEAGVCKQKGKYADYARSSWGHNTILVDGQSQNRRDCEDTHEAKAPQKNLWLHNGVFDAANGIYESGYGPSHIPVKHQRTVVFVRPKYWVVLDRLEAKGKHDYDIIWNLNSRQAAFDRNLLSAWSVQKNASNLQIIPARNYGLSLRIASGQHEPPLGLCPVSSKTPVATLNYKLRQADGAQTLAWVLYPFEKKRPKIEVAVYNLDKGSKVIINHEKGIDSVLIAKPDFKDFSVQVSLRDKSGGLLSECTQ